MDERLKILQEMRDSIKEDTCLFFALNAAIDAYLGLEDLVKYDMKVCQAYK